MSFEAGTLLIALSLVYLAMNGSGAERIGALLGAGVLAVIFVSRGEKGATSEYGVRPLANAPLDLASVRIALSARVYASFSSSNPQLHATIDALLAHQNEWVFASLDSSPKLPREEITAGAGRLHADALRRYALSPPQLEARQEPFRQANLLGDTVFVVSIVVTSEEQIPNVDGETGTAVATVLGLLRSIDRVRSVDIFVSTCLSVDELAKRDPAMRGIA